MTPEERDRQARELARIEGAPPGSGGHLVPLSGREACAECGGWADEGSPHCMDHEVD